jgi:hypothetical protein
MNLNVKSITTAMLEAVRGEVADRWPAARALAEAELRKLATTFADVQKMLADRQITLARARALIRMQENSARGVLRTVEGVSVLTSRRAISAAMRVAASLVNPAIGAAVIHAEQLLSTKQPETPTGNSSTPDQKKAVAATRATGRASRTTAASTEPAEGATPSFKAGKDL